MLASKELELFEAFKERTITIVAAEALFAQEEKPTHRHSHFN